MDESPKQLIAEIKEPIKGKPGSVEKYHDLTTAEIVCNIFMANEPLRGKRYVKVTKQKKKQDWAIYIKEIANKYGDAEKITLVMDNYGTHTPGAFYEVFSPEEAKALWDRFEFVFTPKHGSWLNMAEIELNVLMGQCLNRRIDMIEEIERQTSAWETARNNKDSKINWQFTANNAVSSPKFSNV